MKREARDKKTAKRKATTPRPPAKKKSVSPAPTTVDASDWKRVSRTQLAELLGVHPDTVSHFTRQGMPVLQPGGHGKESVYDSVDSLTWWRSRNAEEQDALDAARTRAQTAQAERAELEIAIRRGEYIPVSEAIAAAQTFSKAVAGGLRMLPHQARQRGCGHYDTISVLVRELQDSLASSKLPSEPAEGDARDAEHPVADATLIESEATL